MIAFLLANWRLLAVLGALAGLFGVGHHLGAKSVQQDWDAAKVEQQIAQQAADEAQRLKSHAAALSYEQNKAARQVRVVTVTTEVSHALDSSPAWRDELVPDFVRESIAAAGQAIATAQPDGALRVPNPQGADERAIGPGVRFGDREPRRLLGPASSPR